MKKKLLIFVIIKIVEPQKTNYDTLRFIQYWKSY